jgi:hypothetical protein
MAEGLTSVRRDMAEGFAAVRQEMAQQRVELLKWAFVFRMGQFVAMVGLAPSLRPVSEKSEVFAISLAFKLITMNEAEGRGVHAVTQTSPVPRSVRKQMAEVTVAVLGAHLGAGHSVGPVDVFDHVRWFQGLCEAGPTGAAVEFIDGRE